MRDLTEFEKRQIVGARMAGASVTKTTELLSFSRATISRTIKEFNKHGKTSATGVILARLPNLPAETDMN